MSRTELRAVRRPVCLLWCSPRKGRSSSSAVGLRTPNRQTRYICFREIGADTAKNWRIHRFGSKTHSDLAPIPILCSIISFRCQKRTIYSICSAVFNITGVDIDRRGTMYCACHTTFQLYRTRPSYRRKSRVFRKSFCNMDLRQKRSRKRSLYIGFSRLGI